MSLRGATRRGNLPEGHLIQAMMRCFCLWQKRCACGAMCVFGTLRSASRVRKRSVYAQQPRFCANALHLTLRVRLLAMFAAFDFRKCKRLLLSSLAVSREGLTAKQCAFLLKRTDSPPHTKTTAVAVVFWCTRGESNPRHPASEAGALSN